MSNKIKHHDLFSGPYPVQPHERAPFGDHWCLAAETLTWGVWTLCAVYETDCGCCDDDPEADAQRAEVWVCAMPARFYEVRRRGFKLNTGSARAQLAADIAQAFADGMLVVEAVAP